MKKLASSEDEIRPSTKMKPQTPGRGFFYALAQEETGKNISDRQDFRACILNFSRPR